MWAVIGQFYSKRKQRLVRSCQGKDNSLYNWFNCLMQASIKGTLSPPGPRIVDLKVNQPAVWSQHLYN